jgi:hypothetical protein
MTGFTGGYYEHSNEGLSFKKGRGFLGWLSEYHLFKKNSAP